MNLTRPNGIYVSSDLYRAMRLVAKRRCSAGCQITTDDIAIELINAAIMTSAEMTEALAFIVEQDERAEAFVNQKPV